MGSAFAPPAGHVAVVRELELSQLRRALERSVGGAGMCVVLTGPPGAGKTTLAGVVAAEARRGGALLLRGRALDGAAPYGPWLQMLQEEAALTHDAAGSDELAASLEALPVEQAASAPQNDSARLAVFHRLVVHLRVLTDQQPVVVVFEDAHAADPGSVALLDHVAAAVSGIPLLALVTVRAPPGLPSGAGAGLARHATTLTLPALTGEEIAALATEIGGTQPAPALVEAVHRASGGIPLLADAVLRRAAGAGAGALAWPTSPMEVPDEARPVIRQWLAGLSEEAMRVLTVAAVVGDRFTLRPLRLLTHRPTGALADALAEAVAAGLLTGDPTTGYEFRHGLVRRYLSDDLEPGRRATLHLRVGEVLAGLSGDDDPACPPEQLAHHFLEALPYGDPGLAVRYTQRAARKAYVEHDYAAAAAFSERLLEVTDPEAVDRVPLLLELGQAQWRAGRVRAARRTFSRAATRARSIGDRQQLALAALGVGGGRVEPGTVDHELIDLLEEALDGLDDVALRVRLLGRLAVALYFTPERERRDALSAEAVRLAGDDAALAAAALAARHFAIWEPDTLGERLRIAAEIVAIGRRTGDRELMLEGRLWSVVDLLEAGDVTAADAQIDTFIGRAADAGLPLYDWYAALLTATRALWRGPLDEVERALEVALDAGTRADVGSAGQFSGVQLYVLRDAQGRLAELEQPVRSLIDSYPDYEVWTCALARLLVTTGRHAEARELVEPLAGDGFAGLPRDVNWLVSLALLAEVSAALGAVDQAEQLYRLLEPFAHRLVVVASAAACLGPVSYYLGTLAACLRESDAAIRHFDEALALATDASAPVWIDRITRRREAVRRAALTR